LRICIERSDPWNFRGGGGKVSDSGVAAGASRWLLDLRSADDCRGCFIAFPSRKDFFCDAERRYWRAIASFARACFSSAVSAISLPEISIVTSLIVPVNSNGGP
jgi:hypothetical protein